MNKDDFSVRQHLRFVEHYSKPSVLDSLNWEDIGIIGGEIANLILPYDDNIDAIRFDAIIRSIQSLKLQDRNYGFLLTHLQRAVDNLSKKSTIPDVQSKIPFIRLAQDREYLERADLLELEELRKQLRDIMQYMDKDHKVRIDTLFTDVILSQEECDPLLNDDGLSSYYENVERYVRNNQDNPAILKLRENEPLTPEDVQALEKILWNDLGTKEDYINAVGSKPIGMLIRSINGLSREAAKKAFSQYLDESIMDNSQIYFVNTIVEYIVQNGYVDNNKIFTESPFTDRGSVVELFPDTDVWRGIRSVIDDINHNAGF